MWDVLVERDRSAIPFTLEYRSRTCGPEEASKPGIRRCGNWVSFAVLCLIDRVGVDADVFDPVGVDVPDGKWLGRSLEALGSLPVF